MVDHSPDEVEYPPSPNNAVMWYLIVSFPGTIILIGLFGAYALGGLALQLPFFEMGALSDRLVSPTPE